MQDDVSTYFALVYRRREPVLVMKRVKRQAIHLGNLKVGQTRFRLNFLFCVFVFFLGVFVFEVFVF